jgi:hypothetical protein
MAYVLFDKPYQRRVITQQDKEYLKQWMEYQFKIKEADFLKDIPTPAKPKLEDYI